VSVLVQWQPGKPNGIVSAIEWRGAKSRGVFPISSAKAAMDIEMWNVGFASWAGGSGSHIAKHKVCDMDSEINKDCFAFFSLVHRPLSPKVLVLTPQCI
jgi:hypothetical protein